MRKYLAEAFLPRSRAGVLGEIDARLRIAAEQVSREGSTVCLVRSLVVPSDETCFHIYLAVSPEAVLASGRRALVPFLRVVEVDESAGTGGPCGDEPASRVGRQAAKPAR